MGAEGRRRQRLDDAIDLLEHPRDRQRREVRLVEVRTVHGEAPRPQALGKLRRLGGGRRGGEAVEVEHVHGELLIVDCRLKNFRHALSVIQRSSIVNRQSPIGQKTGTRN